LLSPVCDHETRPEAKCLFILTVLQAVSMFPSKSLIPHTIARSISLDQVVRIVLDFVPMRGV